MALRRGCLRWGLGAVAALALATLVGAAVALGPLRWTHGDRLAGAAGTALLALALGALAVGWYRTTRGQRWYVRWPAALAVLVGTAVVAEPATVAVWASWPSHADLAGAPPAGALDVSIPAPGGVALAGWYVPGRNGAGLVLAHGASSTRGSLTEHAAVLLADGFSVLLLDARGHGGSGGRPMDLGWWGEADLTAAVDWLAGRPEVAPGRIGLVGLSMGGEEALGAAGADPRVAAVVAEGATGRTAQDKAAWLPRHALGGVQRGMDAWRDVLVGALSDAPRPPSLGAAVARTRARVLLVTGARVPDEAAAARALQAAALDRVEVWTVPDAGHVGGLATDPAGWHRRVGGFLATALAPGPST